ncbi:MAG: TadE/TadG family type IV pilus assembly protein [Myxococcota bacterium]
MSRHRPPPRRANAAIEFVLMLPMMLLLLGGIVDGSLFLVDRHAAVRAARDGTRVGASVVEPPPATGDLIEAKAKLFAERSLTSAGIVPDAVMAEWHTDDDGWSYITLTVIVPHRALFGRYSPFNREIIHSFTMLSQEQGI